MGPAPVFLFFLGAANPSRCLSLCLFTSFFYVDLIAVPLSPPFIFISLRGAFVVLTLVFLSGLSCAAYMVAFLP